MVNYIILKDKVVAVEAMKRAANEAISSNLNF
jgi:hypothetical protein